ncbi:hypothetical protein BKN51_03190 [Amycolatopsis sp. BJA-103]|nr:hypothetical protein BKN51_03190 [Amycolatopsis sp. BJA-103]
MAFLSGFGWRCPASVGRCGTVGLRGRRVRAPVSLLQVAEDLREVVAAIPTGDVSSVDPRAQRGGLQAESIIAALVGLLVEQEKNRAGGNALQGRHSVRQSG